MTNQQTSELQTTIAENYWQYWRLVSDKGRQYWVFENPEADDEFFAKMADSFTFDKVANSNSADLVYRAQCASRKIYIAADFRSFPLANEFEKDCYTSMLNGFQYYNTLQAEDGHWPGDYGGPLFLLPGLVFVSYITKTPFDKPVESLLKQYMLNHQNQDGGWGLHIEGRSTMFGTVMQYVSLRLLGIDKSDARLEHAGRWIKENGGATHIPPWGKFYLSILGIYEWNGNDSLFPELWMLSRQLPFHPGRYWCHSRMVYLPMSYCYGHRIKAEPTALLEELKNELYVEDFDKIKWRSCRQLCAETDTHEDLTNLFKVFNSVANTYENVKIPFLRNKALAFILEYIESEDRDTNYVDIGPVNQVLNSLCIWHQYGKESTQFKKHVDRWKDYLWLAEDGMKMNGYNGSQLWDTAFAAQALIEAKLVKAFPETSSKIHSYLDVSQIKRDPEDSKRFFRTPSKGGWPFSTVEHGWPITDCTSEGMKTMIQLCKDEEHLNFDDKRYHGAIDYLLRTQNENGGWGSYEESRAPDWLEKLNPSRIFTGIMPEHPYVECSSASMQGLKKFNDNFPGYKAEEIKTAIKNGNSFIKDKQRNDGSWYGSWGVCFTYATWFGIEGLLASGASAYDSENPSKEIVKACKFLLSKKKADGSWGESFESCVTKEYVQHSDGQVVNTAWALLGLMAAQHPDKSAIKRGIEFILSRQQDNGDWPQEGISGVFNGNCMITYTAYRNVFPLWAIARYFHNYNK
ncbi:MAG: terpene cyclase/mutase family protein [Chitinophagales bacterium]|nr:terpene cyclase/mutase family protein [Chitinophagales bacterium]